MALKIEDGAKHSGKFVIDGKALDGELTFAGNETKLYVHNADFFRPDAIADRCVQGKLHDLTNVSLMACLAGSVPGSTWSTEGKFHFADVQPHYVLHGRRHLGTNDKLVQEISFTLGDATAIFQDYDAFATAISPTQAQIRSLTKDMAKVAKRKIPVGPRPQIAYFTGKTRIFRVKTVYGTVFTSHSPSFNMGGPKGVHIDNHIWTGIRFEKPVVFQTAIESLFPLLKFMQIIAGRQQEISHVSLLLNEKDPVKKRLNVYWCMPPKRPAQARRSHTLHVVDLPIDAIRESKLFERVLKDYLARHDDWRAARWRFSDGFAKEQWFDIDRLVGGANMFDLLPSTAVPKSVTLTPELQSARKNSETLFKALAESPERDSVLGALGRLRKPNLKRKIRHRAVPVVAALGSRLPHLLDVLDLAVDARNYFVHGGATKLDFAGALQPSLHFLTEALEFTFALSDLHEAGWPVGNIIRNGTVQSHPFGMFLAAYAGELDLLKTALPSSHRIHAAVPPTSGAAI